MKKLIGALALAAMVATSAFAEVSFGAWLCNLPTLVGFDGEDIKGAAVSNPWGGFRASRIDINWTSDDGKAGMTMGVYGNPTSLGPSDAMDFWVKPIDQVKITIGQMDNFTGLRGDLCYGSWNWLRPGNTLAWGEGITFSAVSDCGIGVQVFPVEALQIFASLPLTAQGFKSQTDLSRMDQAFGKGKVGAAYTIDGIGKIKAQFLGKYSITDGNPGHNALTKGWYTVKNGVYTHQTDRDAADDAAAADDTGATKAVRIHKDETSATAASDAYKSYGTIEAAFDLTAVDKLFATVGVAFTMADKEWFVANSTKKDPDSGFVTLNPQFKLALGASYGITEAFKLSADFSMFMFHSDTKIDPMMAFGVGVDYALSDALALAADVRMLMPNNSNDPSLSFLVGATYAVGSNASLGLGFQGAVGLGDKADPGYLRVVKATEGNKFAWAVPVRASIWF
ncbi:MAG: hypothetical protein VZQ47_04065 [Treponema sp.]|nr:hypothetical protein [Treponema sp.]MEE3434716.1 hypothetical protein [Treponema sp.]